MHIRYAVSVLVVLGLAPGCAGVSPSARYERAPCPFKVPAGARVDCGQLIVPENYLAETGRSVRLPVAVYRTDGASPSPDPIVWVVGGPGGRAHALSSNTYTRTVAPYLGKRDFIVMEIRGTGYAEPALHCAANEANGPGLRTCRERLAKAADLAQYHGAAVARDLDSLRKALGYQEWNLLGESYGTRIALTAIRDRSEGIRAVVLDSVVAPEIDSLASGPEWMAKSLETMFRNCAADRRCRGAYPNLEEALRDAAAALDKEPLAITGQLHGRPYPVMLNGAGLMSALRMALYEADLIPQIPRAIYRARQRREDAVWTRSVGLLAVVQQDLVDLGAHYSFACRETTPFASAARLRAADERFGWLRGAASDFTELAACRIWSVPAGGPIEREPVRSTIPTLLLSGEYDPATPASNARSAARGLANAYQFVFPGLSHWVTANPVSDCPSRIVLKFLDDPRRAPASDCFGQLQVQWALPFIRGSRCGSRTHSDMPARRPRSLFPPGRGDRIRFSASLSVLLLGRARKISCARRNQREDIETELRRVRAAHVVRRGSGCAAAAAARAGRGARPGGSAHRLAGGAVR